MSAADSLPAVFSSGTPISALFVDRSDAQALESLKSQHELYQAIAALDAAVFDSYNRCDLEKFSSFVASDLELYHDLDGMVAGKQRLKKNIKKFVCGGDVR